MASRARNRVRELTVFTMLVRLYWDPRYEPLVMAVKENQPAYRPSPDRTVITSTGLLGDSLRLP